MYSGTTIISELILFYSEYQTGNFRNEEKMQFFVIICVHAWTCASALYLRVVSIKKLFTYVHENSLNISFIFKFVFS
jgi:hypothetical protein